MEVPNRETMRREKPSSIYSVLCLFAQVKLGQPLSNLLEIGSISFPLFVFLSINMSFSHFKIRMQGRFRVDRTCWEIL